jgi:hypothetical protein
MCYVGEFDGVLTPGKYEVTKAALVSIMLKAAFEFVPESEFQYCKTISVSKLQSSNPDPTVCP